MANNWQASIILLANLNDAVGAETRLDMYAIFVDLFLRSLAPYFRIMGLWVTQGRLEDWRDEFIYAVNPEFHTSQMKLQRISADGSCSATGSSNTDTDAISDEECDFEAADSQTTGRSSRGLHETFWTRGFISRPYSDLLREKAGFPTNLDMWKKH